MIDLPNAVLWAAAFAWWLKYPMAYLIIWAVFFFLDATMGKALRAWNFSRRA